MWISKKKYKKLEKRIADLEKQVQSQQLAQTVISEINDITRKNKSSPLLRACAVRAVSAMATALPKRKKANG